ncbi:putative Zn(II)2Cys6 transcription factor [Dactylonectria estremocensis]|uniref:Zn(II)2Cys6 transcription factor n=1 Tax=Dactylonectria estremocensis TaxID=1079267 RepID=A0A9P9FBU7_9HYPO|nr:putative Zn(II)2Cys6 transcription factor [Dactylonectria estremocensis]
MEDEDGPDQPGYADDMSRAPEVGLACNSCRRRKLRCSRETPTCQHCRKTGRECVYEAKRAKPGMKTGAIENLHRRLDTLERSVARQQTTLDCLQAEEEAPARQSQDPSAHSILSLLAAELQKFHTPPSAPLQSSPSQNHNGASTKRRRLNDDHTYAPSGFGNCTPDLPEGEALEEVLKSYFSHVHPWMPIIHESRFRQRLSDDAERGKLHLVLQSMIIVVSRYIEDDFEFSSDSTSQEKAEGHRDWVVSKAMKHLSVENLQALLIIAFNDATSQAWPLVGSLTRMADYLQLTVEHDEPQRPSYSQPYKSLSTAKDWTEAEERRRVFWNVFSLDRFCSIPVTTPYFGIWDKSAGRIGKPIAFFPAHPVPLQTSPDDEGQTPSEAGTSPEAASSTVDMSTVGAFAYCIEATESLSRVSSYFLQQKVNIRDQRDLSDWLTRFKELDLRLVHWKMLLPQKWKVNMVQDSPLRMDPNLTLAHVTHNTSMILLHQPIAFPPQDWPFKTRLPSLCSIDTCQAAAVEIATITDRYLKSASSESLISSQFAFCVYIAARVLLLHWRNGSLMDLTAEFWLLIQSLKAISKRWAGTEEGPLIQKNLAAKYADILVQLHARCAQDESFSINVPGYTTEVNHSNTDIQRLASSAYVAEDATQNGISTRPSPNTQISQNQPTQLQATAPITLSRRRTSTHQATVPEPQQAFIPQNAGNEIISSAYSLQMATPVDLSNVANMIQPDNYHRGSVGMGDLTAISQILLDQQFADMDRIISYDDGVFGSEYEGGGW